MLAAVIFGIPVNGFVCNSEAAVFKAKVADIQGQAVEGVKLFFYESSNVRKPADFISSQTDKAGSVLIDLPVGKYWVVARLKKDPLYGPLMPGDRHSGEPLEVEVAGDGGSVAEFTVADILEIGQKKRTDADLVRLRGRVLDNLGKPVANVYAFAHKSKNVEYVPDYISSWTGEDGTYSLFIPSSGKFFIGSAREFPLATKITVSTEVVADKRKRDVAMDIQLIVY
jgi:hypothetical protein